ncbi:LysR family transcriptional regulator [Ralstonia soli]|uniref:LysR family transcriptional regulator n=1 Tax=Ralstonia soli TaxID=2953896 RepID=A0ABT1AKV3_9RALS|nr:LysR family transcriptional regulator [Ralstonia soli]MCO5399055.1 LysR family transcriptional regulator [Ralstonia soli]
MRLRTEEIEAYLRVVEFGSVSGAARGMALSKSVVSKRISDLEHSLGASLLQRSTRSVQPTEAGRHFYEQARAAMAQLIRAAESLSETSRQLCGELRILAPMSFGTLWLSPLIADFAKAHPRLHVAMELEDRQADTRHERYDVAIRVARLGDSALIARRLAVSRRIVCCSPAYAERAGLPADLDELHHHACLSYSNALPTQIWAFHGKPHQIAPRVVSPRGVFTANNGEVLRDAAVAGHGIAVLPLFIVAADLAAGRLIQALPEEEPIEDGVFAVYPRSAFTLQKIRTLVAFLQAAMSPPPWDVSNAAVKTSVPQPALMLRHG